MAVLRCESRWRDGRVAKANRRRVPGRFAAACHDGHGRSAVGMGRRWNKGDLFEGPPRRERLARADPHRSAGTWADAVQVTSEQAFIEFVDVSTDGRRLLVSSDRGGNQDIWMLAAGGGAMQQLTTDPTPDWDPRWSPDSSQIAFYSYRSGNRDIWTMPANGGAARQLTSDPGPDLQPTWSPDGTQIAFLCGRADGSHTCVVPARGGRTRDLGRGIDAEWARDSSSLIVQMIGQDGPSHSLWRVRLDGSSLEPITAGPANRPRRSRDGADVYYVGARERAGNIWSASLGRRLERPLTQFAARRGQLENALSTDGRSIYFIWEEDLGDIWVMDVRNPGAR